MTVWKNERPDWCPYPNCIFKMNTQNLICTGKLTVPESHDSDENTHRLCFNERETGHGIHDLQINRTDAWFIKRHVELVINSPKKIRNDTTNN